MDVRFRFCGKIGILLRNFNRRSHPGKNVKLFFGLPLTFIHSTLNHTLSSPNKGSHALRSFPVSSLSDPSSAISSGSFFQPVQFSSVQLTVHKTKMRLAASCAHRLVCCRHVSVAFQAMHVLVSVSYIIRCSIRFNRYLLCSYKKTDYFSPGYTVA